MLVSGKGDEMNMWRTRPLMINREMILLNIVSKNEHDKVAVLVIL